jgi:hypothetical protein
MQYRLIKNKKFAAVYLEHEDKAVWIDLPVTPGSLVDAAIELDLTVSRLLEAHVSKAIAAPSIFAERFIAKSSAPTLDSTPSEIREKISRGIPVETNRLLTLGGIIHVSEALDELRSHDMLQDFNVAICAFASSLIHDDTFYHYHWTSSDNGGLSGFLEEIRAACHYKTIRCIDADHVASVLAAALGEGNVALLTDGEVAIRNGSIQTPDWLIHATLSYDSSKLIPRYVNALTSAVKY